VTLPDGIKKLPTGVVIHGQRLRISFVYCGDRCRETIPCNGKITKASIAHAERKRNQILTEIYENRFDYATHFPGSSKAKLYSGWGGSGLKLTVPEYVKMWLEIQEKLQALTTYKNYASKARHVSYFWTNKRLSDITKPDIELFRVHLLEKGLSVKTITDIFTIVRGIWSYAFDIGAIEKNPLSRISNLKSDKMDTFADPFTLKEIDRIQSVRTMRQQDINMVMFACWCGLSVSELIALSWDDVDIDNWTVHVKRARVGTEYKVPKERSRDRIVELIEPAKLWLQRQMQSTYLQLPSIIEVRQRNNITTKEETIRLVFKNGQSNQPWHYASLHRWLTGHLKRAGVRHRGPNQARHTFASQMVSNYVSLEWISRQLGHSDTSMVKKHYAKWIPDDSPKMAAKISQQLGFIVDSSGQ
jgi:integrase